MKASIKFREDRNPLFRAKIPLKIIGFPFQSGIVAGDSKELSLNLSTFFDSGPSFKISYRPNDSLNPFSLVFKTGIGHFGSPISSAMNMTAEFNLIGNQNPRFFLHFKPQFGDFTVKKSQSSVFAKSGKSDGDLEIFETPVVNNRFEKIMIFPAESSAAGVARSILSGMEVGARTAVPLRNRAVVNFRWRVRLPAAETAEEAVVVRINPTAGISFQKLPQLVMNKIGIEHVVERDSKDSNEVGHGLNLPGNADVVEACLDVKRQVEFIQMENGILRRAMDDLRSEIVAVKSISSSLSSETDWNSNGDRKTTKLNGFGFGGKVVDGDVNEEVTKAAMGV